ncbi:MAG: GNAT family N-acetyltransferase, partial [Candidatus Eremiobacteraeota bacterium]|nr:GNAT family N-acetyltransferase [Candidatus Eremiobacteraeota bacterium]
MSNQSNCFLRPYTRSDKQALANLFMDAEVMRYVGDGRTVPTAAVREIMDRIFHIYDSDPSFLIWAIQESDEYAGHAELKRRKGRGEYELIYILQRSRWGRSLGTHVVDLLLAEARKRLIPFVIATVDPEKRPPSPFSSVAVFHLTPSYRPHSVAKRIDYHCKARLDFYGKHA